MSRTLSADVIALGAKHGATIHANLAYNALRRGTRFRVTCIADEPRALPLPLQALLRQGGFHELRVTYPALNRLQIDAL